jgi:hypothetical protein
MNAELWWPRQEWIEQVSVSIRSRQPEQRAPGTAPGVLQAGQRDSVGDVAATHGRYPVLSKN